MGNRKDASYDHGKLSNTTKQRRSQQENQKRQQFLKGPVPLAWLCRAAALPGKAFVVAVALWYRAGVCRGREVTVGAAVLDRFGVSRATAYRGLSALESAGLVAVDRKRGRLPRITILELDSDA